MRQIKFRAWNESANRYSKPFTLKCDVLNYTDDDGLGVIKSLTNELVEQFTGSIDKNGVEIYEGDILRHNKYRTTKDVEWVDGCGFQCYIDCDDEFDDLMGYIPKMIEVIGNIHENKK
jgi:hypothetical protein